MEIRSSWFAAMFRLAILLPFAVAGWAMAASEMETEWGFRMLMFVGMAIIGSMGVWTYGRRTLRAFLGRPEFVLSRSGICANGRLLRWNKLSRLEYRCQNHRGYRNHTCWITLADGGDMRLDLDTVSLSPRRVMLLIDFYASGATLP